MTSDTVFLPARLVRVVWDAGYGWPTCVRRARTARNFTSARTAAEQVAVIRAWPSHHRLVGVYESNELTWTAIDADTLPVPETIEDGDGDGGLD